LLVLNLGRLPHKLGNVFLQWGKDYLLHLAPLRLSGALRVWASKGF
jgi:hypothetical protein